MSLYPEHNWLPWKFSQVTRGYWTKIENQRKYMEWLQKELKIENWEEWYQVSKQVQ